MVSLVAASAWYGRFAFVHAVNPPDYHYLAPAVMVATGQGFRVPVPTPGSPLDDFLVRRTEALDARDAVPQALAEPEPFHSATRYLLIAVGWWWRLSGIAWDHVAGVAAALHVMAVLGAYATFRLFLPLGLSALGALWICTSTLQLAFVPHVRDYSKAAFILAALPLVVALALKVPSRAALLGAAAGFGFLIGVGFGFRMDVAVMVPLAIGAIVLFRGRRPWTDLPEKAVAVAVLAICLALPAWPVVSELSRGGSNESHVVLLGLADGFDTRLEVHPSVYRIVPFYSDSYVSAMVGAYAASSGSAPLSVPSPEYAAASRQLWLDIVRTFPADLYGRAVASTNVVMNLVFRAPDPTFLTRPPPAVTAAVGLYAWLNRFDGLGAWLGVCLVLLASAIGLRHGVLAAMLLFALAGYTSLQFSDRHYFHIQIVPLFALLLLLRLGMAATWVAARGIWSRRLFMPPAWDLRAGVLRVGVGALVMASLTVVPLFMLRALQAPHVQRTFRDVLRSDRTPLQLEWSHEGRGSWLARVRGGGAGTFPGPGAADSAYYVLEVEGTDRSALAVGVRYATAVPDADFSRVMSLTPEPGINRVGFAPLTPGAESSFVGFELGERTKEHFVRAYRLSTGPAGLPLDLLLPADWTSRALYERLRLEGATWRSVGPRVVCAGPAGCGGLLGFLDAHESLGHPPAADEIAFVHSPIVHVGPTGISVAGVAESDSSYLLQGKDWASEGPGALVLQGFLHQGGVAIGLLVDRRWHRQVSVTDPGEFVVILPMDGPGVYQPLVANALPAGHRRNELTITRWTFLSSASIPE